MYVHAETYIYQEWIKLQSMELTKYNSGWRNHIYESKPTGTSNLLDHPCNSGSVLLKYWHML